MVDRPQCVVKVGVAGLHIGLDTLRSRVEFLLQRLRVSKDCRLLRQLSRVSRAGMGPTNVRFLDLVHGRGKPRA
jgi:hypothetical protein